MESDYSEIIEWLQNVKEIQFTYSQKFADAWKPATGIKKAFSTDNPKYQKLCEELKEFHLRDKRSYKIYDNEYKIRRFRYGLSVSGHGKDKDGRIMYALYRNPTIIYFTAIAPQKDHHKNIGDNDALDDARIMITTYSKLINQDPV